MKKLIYLFFFTVLAFNSFAAEKIKYYPQQGILRFKGLDDTSSLLTVKDERASDLQNVKLSLSSSLEKRKGYDVVGQILNESFDSDDFPAATGLYYAKLSSGSEFILSIVGRKVYNLSSGEWSTVSNPVDYVTYDKNNQFVWIVGLDTIIFTNDTDPPYKYTGSGSNSALDVSDLSDALTKVKTLAWFKNYLVLGNTVEASTERPTRFRWSNVGTIETFSDDDYIDIAALGGQEIVGFIELYDNLYILMTDSIWKASLVGGNDIFVISKVVDDIGCIAKNSIQTINLLNQRKGIVFLSKDKKIYFYDGNTIGDISVLISNVMDGLRADRLEYAVSADTGKSYLLCVTSGNSATTNNLLLEFQYEIGEWTKHTNINANAMAKVVDSNSLSKIYFGNYDSFIYELDTSLDSDVVGQTGGVDSIETGNMFDNTATGLTAIITDNAIDYEATGAIITITSGTGISEKKVIVDHDATSLIVDSDFDTEPDGSSLFSIGEIDAFYKTKWYDLGEPVRIKGINDLYLWVEEEGGVSISVEEFLDFSSVLQTESVSLQGEGGIWGTAVWNTDVWGGEEALFKKANLTGEGRFLKLNFSNDEIDEYFNILGFVPTFEELDIQ